MCPFTSFSEKKQTQKKQPKKVGQRDHVISGVRRRRGRWVGGPGDSLQMTGERNAQDWLQLGTGVCQASSWLHLFSHPTRYANGEPHSMRRHSRAARCLNLSTCSAHCSVPALSHHVVATVCIRFIHCPPLIHFIK